MFGSWKTSSGCYKRSSRTNYWSIVIHVEHLYPVMSSGLFYDAVMMLKSAERSLRSNDDRFHSSTREDDEKVGGEAINVGEDTENTH